RASDDREAASINGPAEGRCGIGPSPRFEGIDTPDLALVTTATRSRETWKLMVSELPQRPRSVYDERLYEASLGMLLAVMNETPDEVSDLLVLGGNPGIHAAADALAGEADGDLLARMNRSSFPTSAIAVLTFNGSWKAVEHGVAKLVAFWAP
ncbi:SixA phosphatase family protein, partial [Nonomuraea sp. NPDC050451]|uniref:SixA phosphatase family protein n=1 Tax=Nonomuraea sp. NPDC050451 TaxID=3364364 RepID=UPI0037AB39BF